VGEIRTLLIPAVDGLAYGLLLSLLSAGLSLCWGTGKVLNLAHGTVYLIGAYTTVTLSHGSWPSLAAAVAVGTVAGAVAGGGLAVATRPVAGRGPLPQALLTFGLALIGADLLADAFGANPRPVTVPPAIDTTVSLSGQAYPLYRLALIVVTATVIGCGALVMRYSRAGLLARAAVDNPTLLATFGVNARRIHTSTLIVAGALAAFAGTLGAPIITPAPTSGDTVLLLCLIVVVIGGLRRIGGVLAAGIAVGEVQSLGPVLTPTVTPYLLFGSLALVLVMRRPHMTGVDQ
jgi:branched-chain amino acid transport system permease protein